MCCVNNDCAAAACSYSSIPLKYVMASVNTLVKSLYLITADVLLSPIWNNCTSSVDPARITSPTLASINRYINDVFCKKNARRPGSARRGTVIVLRTTLTLFDGAFFDRFFSGRLSLFSGGGGPFSSSGLLSWFRSSNQFSSFIYVPVWRNKPSLEMPTTRKSCFLLQHRWDEWRWDHHLYTVPTRNTTHIPRHFNFFGLTLTTYQPLVSQSYRTL